MKAYLVFCFFTKESGKIPKTKVFLALNDGDAYYQAEGWSIGHVDFDGMTVQRIFNLYATHQGCPILGPRILADGSHER